MSIQGDTLIAIADAIRIKDKTTAPIKANDFAQRILDIPSGEDLGSGAIQVRFLLIDQTTGQQKIVVKRCYKGGGITPPTVGDVPEVDGVCPALTFQGWNYDLDVLDNITHNYDIGAMYIPTDGKTWARIRVTKNSGADEVDALTQIMYLGITGAGNTYIDWGDGVVDTLTVTGYINQSHTYAQYTDYWVKIWRDSGTYALGNRTANTSFWGGSIEVKRNTVKSIYIGENVNILYAGSFYGYRSLNRVSIPHGVVNCDSQVFSRSSIVSIVFPNGIIDFGVAQFELCYLLESISIPYGVTNIKSNSFLSCISLNSIIIPESVLNIENLAFQGCTILTELILPMDIKVINNATFYQCYLLLSMIIHKGITTIAANAFGSTVSLSIMDLREVTSVPILGGAIGASNTNALYVVPDSLYSQFIVATNWAASAKQIISQTDYENTYGN